MKEPAGALSRPWTITTKGFFWRVIAASCFSAESNWCISSIRFSLVRWVLFNAGALSFILLTRSALAPLVSDWDFNSVTICCINGCNKSFSERYLLALKSIIFKPALNRSFDKSDIADFLSPSEPPNKAIKDGGFVLPTIFIIFEVAVVDMNIFSLDDIFFMMKLSLKVVYMDKKRGGRIAWPIAPDLRSGP